MDSDTSFSKVLGLISTSLGVIWLAGWRAQVGETDGEIGSVDYKQGAGGRAVSSIVSCLSRRRDMAMEASARAADGDWHIDHVHKARVLP